MNASANEARAAALRDELERVLSILQSDYHPQEVYLYGSFATGNVAEWSDLDLVLVKETERSFYDRMAQVINLVKPRVGMDIVVYTPREWNRLCKERRFVQDEIVGKGKRLYAA